MSLLKEIQAELIDPKLRLSDILRKCHVLAYRLKQTSLQQWISNELNGYSDEENLPIYRVLKVQSYGSFLGYGIKAGKLPIPATVLDKRFRKFAETAPIKQGVASLESLVADQDADSLQMSWPHVILAKYSLEIIQDMSCIGAWREIPRSSIVGILDTIRNRVLGFVLEVESELPDSREIESGAQLPSAESQQKLNQVFNTYIMGGVNNLASGDQHISQDIIMPEPLTILTSLSSLATIARFINDFLLRGERIPLSERDRLEAKAREPAAPSPAAIQAVAKLSDDFRKIFDEQLTKAKERLQERYRRPAAGPAEYKEAYDQAQYQICAVLDAIRRHNGAKLPDDLKALWEEFACNK
jgi:hypothetical protein